MAEPSEVVRLAAAVGRAARTGDAEAVREARAALALAKVRVVLDLAARTGVTFSQEQVAGWLDMVDDDGRIHMQVGGGRVTEVVRDGRRRTLAGHEPMPGKQRYEFDADVEGAPERCRPTEW